MHKEHRQIVCAHLDSRIKVWLVTHLFVLACRLKDTRLDDAFPAGGAKGGGRQDIQAYGGPPLDKSCGKDLFDKIFANGASERAGPMQPQ
jgi:hypothetical protein